MGEETCHKEPVAKGKTCEEAAVSIKVEERFTWQYFRYTAATFISGESFPYFLLELRVYE